MTIQAPTSPTTNLQDCHILLIEEEEGVQCILLESPTYSLGRDPKNSVVLPASKSVSRFHAMLLRIPGANSSEYRYRIVDGDANGKLSTNGVVVNGKRDTSHTLMEGDVIMLGNLKVSYRMIALSFSELEHISIEGLNFKSPLPEGMHADTTLAVDNPKIVPEQQNAQGEEGLPSTIFFKKQRTTLIPRYSQGRCE